MQRAAAACQPSSFTKTHSLERFSSRLSIGNSKRNVLCPEKGNCLCDGLKISFSLTWKTTFIYINKSLSHNSLVGKNIVHSFTTEKLWELMCLSTVMISKPLFKATRCNLLVKDSWLFSLIPRLLNINASGWCLTQVANPNRVFWHSTLTKRSTIFPQEVLFCCFEPWKSFKLTLFAMMSRSWDKIHRLKTFQITKCNYFTPLLSWQL